MNCYRLLAALLLCLPVPALAQWTSGVHDTGVVRFEVFDNGKLGAFFDGDSSSIGEGFIFNGEQGLFEGAFLVGASPDQVSGEIYDFPIVEWATVSPVEPLYHPIFGVDGYEAVYDDSASPNPIGLEVTQFSYSHTDLDEPFVYVEFTVENTSGEALTGLYPGVFADIDVGDFTHNYGLYDENTQLLYVYGSFTSENYFGVTAIDFPTDLNVTGVSYDVLPGDESLYAGLTFIHSIPGASDKRIVLGVGPYDLAAGETVTLTFAFVAGASEAEIISNAEWAQQGFGCLPPCASTDPSAEEQGVALHAAVPNPARGTTTLSFTLDRPMPVHLAVLDALGREVAVLTDGELAAGDHAVTWEATKRPAGVYLARLTASGATHTRTVTLLR